MNSGARTSRSLRARGRLLRKVRTLLQWDTEARGGGRGYNPDPLRAQVWYCIFAYCSVREDGPLLLLRRRGGGEVPHAHPGEARAGGEEGGVAALAGVGDGAGQEKSKQEQTLFEETCGKVHHTGRQCTREEKLKGNFCGVPPESEFVEPKSSRRKLDETGWWDLGSHPEDNL